MQTSPDFRPSPIAGSWYQGNPDALAKEVDRYLNEADLPELDGDVIALIAPHAGHRYSGPVAGYAFASIRGHQPDLVAVVAPMHHPYPQALLTSSHAAYMTPLGEIPIDKKLVSELDRALDADLGMGLSAVPRDPEHSLEIELPFLQRTLNSDFTLLPVMIRTQDPGVARALGTALAAVLKGDNFELVASTDLSHFYDQKTALRYDGVMLEQIEAFSPEGIFEAEKSGQGFACGHAAVSAVLWAARELGGNNVKVLKHATSGDVSGDYASVVGYCAAAILKT